MSSARPSVTPTEEWAEDDGFFTDFLKQASASVSNRKRNRQVEELEQAALRSEIVEDEASRKANAGMARRSISAAVLARASPREVQQAVEKAKKKQEKGKEATEGEKMSYAIVPRPMKRKRRK